MNEADSASNRIVADETGNVCAVPLTEGGHALFQAQEFALVPPGTPGVLAGVVTGIDPSGNPAKGCCLLVSHLGETRRMAYRQAYRVARFVSAVTWLVAAESASPGKMFGRLGMVEREVRAFCLAAGVMAPRDKHPLVGWAMGLLAQVPFGPESPALDALDHLVQAGLAE